MSQPYIIVRDDIHCPLTWSVRGETGITNNLAWAEEFDSEGEARSKLDETSLPNEKYTIMKKSAFSFNPDKHTNRHL